MPFDISEMLRRRNVFGPEGDVDYFNPSFVGPERQPLEERQPLPQRQTLEQPPSYQEGPSVESYRKFLQGGGPRREDYSPSKWNRFGAALTGVSAGSRGRNGFEAASEQLERPYNLATSDYARDAGQLKEAAGLELGSEDIRYRRFLENAQLQNATRNSLSLSGARSARAILNAFKATHPNAVFKSVAGGNIVAFDPQNPSAPIDTGISSGLATDEDKRDFRIQGIEAIGSEQRKTEGVRQSGRMAIEAYKKSHPNSIPIRVIGGNIQAFNPQTQEMVDTGISSGTLTEEDLVRLKAEVTPGTETNIENLRNEAGEVIKSKRVEKKLPVPPKKEAAPPSSDTSGIIEMKDKNGKVWRVKPENVEAFKKANGIQ